MAPIGKLGRRRPKGGWAQAPHEETKEEADPSVIEASSPEDYAAGLIGAEASSKSTENQILGAEEERKSQRDSEKIISEVKTNVVLEKTAVNVDDSDRSKRAKADGLVSDGAGDGIEIVENPILSTDDTDTGTSHDACESSHNTDAHANNEVEQQDKPTASRENQIVELEEAEQLGGDSNASTLNVVTEGHTGQPIKSSDVSARPVSSDYVCETNMQFDDPIVARSLTEPDPTTAAVSLENTSSAPAVTKKPKPPKKTWHDRLLQLIEYKQENGSCLVPTRYKANPQLGKWVHNQREQYKMFHLQTKPGCKKKCSLTEERIHQLKKVGFVWSTERSKKQNEDWHARFQQLKEYRDTNGNCMVPHGFSEDPSLYEWVHRQRVLNAKMLKSDDEPDKKIRERMDLLKSIGFSFAKQNDVWKERLEELRNYKEKFGNCEVPTHYSENPALGRWVISQRYEARKRNKGKKSVITQDRIDLLNELGFNWEKGKQRVRVTWQSRYEDLVSFQKEEGHLNVTSELNPQLFRWCQEQKQRLRQVKKNGKDVSKRMGPDRVQALQAIGFGEN